MLRLAGYNIQARAIGHRKAKKTHAPFLQGLTYTHPRQPNRKTEPHLLQYERKAAKEAAKRWESRRGARLQTCRVAIRGDMSLPVLPRHPSRRVSRSVSETKEKSDEKPTFMTECDTGLPGALDSSH